MPSPESELQIRERIATQIRANPEIGFVHSRARGAINTETIAPLLRDSSTGIIRGVAIRPIGFTQIDSPTQIAFIEKTIRYGLVFMLTFNDDHAPEITSTDYFSVEMIERTDFLLRDYRTLGFGIGFVRHQLLQFTQDWEIRPSERFGKIHVALGTLGVTWFIPANECE